MLNALSKAADKAAGEVPTSTPAVPLKDHSKSMHAVEWHGKKDMRYNQVNWRPMITDQRDILLRVTATSICGSDLHPYKGTMLDMHAGDIMGHEFMGIIEEVGTQVQKLKVGQRVVVAFGIACGSCEYCQREEYTACDTTNPSKLVETMYGHRPASLYGYSHLCGGVPGGQSEYVRVPFAEVNCLVVPDGLLDEQALYLSDVVPTAYHATELGSVKEGSTVAIWGLGPIGLCAARWAQIRGAKRIIGIDGTPERLAMAKNVLKIDTINFKEQDVLKTLFEMEPRGVDTAIEAAGFDFPKTLLHKVEMALTLETDTADILTECITACRKFGTVSIVGVYTGFTNHFPIGAVMEKDLIIKCGQSPTQKYWPLILPKIQSGEFDPTFMITHKGKLSDAPQLYEKFANHEGVIKVFLRP